MKEQTSEKYAEDASGDFLSSFDFIDLRSDKEKQIEREAYDSLSLGTEADSLVTELIEIGRTCDFVSDSGDSYDGNGYHKRAREIGIRLNEIGGMELMLSVYCRVVAKLGPGLGRSLEVAWGYIGGWWP
jgi:hypothetical protein